MIKHVVLYKFTDSISQDVINNIITKFNDCKNNSTGIIDVNFGENCSLKKHLSHGFNYGLFITFKSKDDVLKYNDSEDHKKAKELMNEYLIEKVIFDIDC